MKIGAKMMMGLGLGVALLQLPGRAEDKPALKDQKEKVSYGIGMNWGNQLKRAGFEVDVDVVAAAIRDVLAGHDLKLTQQQAQEAIGAYQKDVRAKQDEERGKIAEKNRKEGEAFLAENKKKEGVKIHSVTLPDGTTAEMQYKILTQGSGPMPKTNDTVTVNYSGTLINGKEFDSSAKRGQPGKFVVNRVVRGWTEALQMMKTGAKWQLVVPAPLAYGEQGAGRDIPPNTTLIFEVELVGVKG